MPLPAPRTWTDGDEPANYPSADILNVDWRDSWDFLLGYSKPMALLHHTTAAVTVPLSPSQIAIPFDTEVLKRGGIVHSNSTNNSRVTVPYSGMYGGYLYLGVGTTTTTAKYTLFLRKNGTTQVSRAGQMAPTTSAGTEIHAAFSVQLAANDYVEFLAQAATTTATTNTNALNRCKMAIWYEGDAA